MLELNLPSFVFSITSNKMVSTNDMYFYVAYKRKGSNRTSTHAVKTKELTEMQDKFIPDLKALIDKSFINDCIKYLETNLYGLSIETEYYMPISNYKGSDVSNYIKAYEDCISYALKESSKILDEKNNLEYLSRKYCNNDDVWKLITTIRIIPRDKYYRSQIIGIDISNNEAVLGKLCPICNSRIIELCNGDNTYTTACCRNCHAKFDIKEESINEKC